MIFMLVALIVLLAAIGAAVWLAIDARRRGAPEPRVGAIALCCGLVTLGLMALHLTAVVGRAISGKGFGGAARFTYDFRFYSLLLMAVVIIIPGLVFVMHARRLTDGDATAWKRALWASGALLLINIPLVPIQAFALDPALLATINLVSLWAGRKQSRSTLVLIAAFAALALPMAVPAQEKNGAAEMSITGCFSKGDVEGQYVLTDEKTNKKITVTGNDSILRGHTHNHKVTVTGSMTKDKDKDVLKATRLQMLWTQTLGCKLRHLW